MDTILDIWEKFINWFTRTSVYFWLKVILQSIISFSKDQFVRDKLIDALTYLILFASTLFGLLQQNLISVQVDLNTLYLLLIILAIVRLVQGIIVLPPRWYFEQRRRANYPNWNEVFFSRIIFPKNSTLGVGIKIHSNHIHQIEGILFTFTSLTVEKENVPIPNEKQPIFPHVKDIRKPLYSFTEKGLHPKAKRDYLIANHKGDKAYFVVSDDENQCVEIEEGKINYFTIEVTGKIPDVKLSPCKISGEALFKNRKLSIRNVRKYE